MGRGEGARQLQSRGIIDQILKFFEGSHRCCPQARFESAKMRVFTNGFRFVPFAKERHKLPSRYVGSPVTDNHAFALAVRVQWPLSVRRDGQLRCDVNQRLRDLAGEQGKGGGRVYLWVSVWVGFSFNDPHIMTNRCMYIANIYKRMIFPTYQAGLVGLDE